MTIATQGRNYFYGVVSSALAALLVDCVGYTLSLETVCSSVIRGIGSIHAVSAMTI